MQRSTFQKVSKALKEAEEWMYDWADEEIRQNPDSSFLDNLLSKIRNHQKSIAKKHGWTMAEIDEEEMEGIDE